MRVLKVLAAMTSHTPLSLQVVTVAVQLFLFAVSVHLFVVLRKRVGVAAAGAVCFVTLLLTLFSDMVAVDVNVFGWIERRPAFWRPLSAVWVAGSFGSYLLYWFWRLYRRRYPAAGVAVSPARRQFLETGAAAALAAPFAVAGYGVYIGRDDVRVEEIDVAIKGLPADLDGVTMTQVTDLHSGPYMTPAKVERVVAMANETRPQIMLVTGDLISRPGDPLTACIDALGELRADSGAWGCMGNHEAYSMAEVYTEEYGASKGLRFLRQANQPLRFGDAWLNLCGVDYQRTTRPYLVGAHELMRNDAVNLLLSHNPDVFQRAAELGYDLTVAGHTHGGQVTLEIVEQTLNPGRFFTPYVVGSYRIGDSSLYVSRGLGTVNLPMRIGAFPEISLLKLRRA